MAQIAGETNLDGSLICHLNSSNLRDISRLAEPVPPTAVAEIWPHANSNWLHLGLSGHPDNSNPRPLLDSLQTNEQLARFTER